MRNNQILISNLSKIYDNGFKALENIDLEIKKVHDLWEADDKQITPHRVETGVFGEKGWSLQISNPIVERGTSGSESGMVTRSDAQRLQQDDGDQGTSVS